MIEEYDRKDLEISNRKIPFWPLNVLIQIVIRDLHINIGTLVKEIDETLY